ncbi:hypothetical protein J1605_011473 [Eschrichtius robustus]|uniref:Neuroendocrine protein 7B2 n=1 Tax=Eschrichtius robustus TaxID=9764 RepID=A0AB34GKJ2_ESCRO|nr:hypothetical protein J1605_011473 [Eschrichtius robustus]
MRGRKAPASELSSGESWPGDLHLLEEGRGGAKMRREVTHQRPRSPRFAPDPHRGPDCSRLLRLPLEKEVEAFAQVCPASMWLTMVARMVSTMLSGLVFWLTFGWTPTAAYSPRTPDRVSETDIQRLLLGVMEQLGIARPRVEYPAHQAMNLVGPQSIEGKNAPPSLTGSRGGGGFRWEVGGVFLCVSVRYVRIRHQHHRDLGGRRRVLLPSLSACGRQRENRGSVPPAMLNTGWMVCGPALSSSRSTCSVLDTLDRKLSGGQRLTPPSTSEDAGAQWVWHSVQ